MVEGVGPIRELAAAELPAYVPLLPDVLEICDGLIVNIEIKNLPGEPGFDPDRSSWPGRWPSWWWRPGGESSVVISSFWPDTLEAVRHAQADLATGLLLASWFDPLEGVAVATDRGCTALHPHIDLVGAALVDRAHEVGLSVATWTVNDRADLLEGGRGRRGHRHHRRRATGAGRAPRVLTAPDPSGSGPDQGPGRYGSRPGDPLGPRPAGGPGTGCPDLGSRPDWSKRSDFNNNARP